MKPHNDKVKSETVKCSLSQQIVELAHAHAHLIANGNFDGNGVVGAMATMNNVEAAYFALSVASFIPDYAEQPLRRALAKRVNEKAGKPENFIYAR